MTADAKPLVIALSVEDDTPAPAKGSLSASFGLHGVRCGSCGGPNPDRYGAHGSAWCVDCREGGAA